MKVALKIDAKQALIEGFDNSGEYILNFKPSDLTEEERCILAQSTKEKDGIFHFDWYPNEVPMPKLGNSSIDSLKKTIGICKQIKTVREDRDRESSRHQAETKRQRHLHDIKEIVKWSQKSPEDHVVENSLSTSHIGYQFKTLNHNRCSEKPYLLKLKPELAEYIEDVESICFWAYLENSVRGMHRKKQSEIQEKIRKEEKKEKDILIKSQIAAFISETASNEQKDRFEAGFMGKAEQLALMRDFYFKDLNEFNRFKKIKASDVCSCEYDLCDVNYEFKDASSLSVKEFALFKQLKEIASKLHTTTVTPRLHTATSSDCEEEVTKTSFLVEIKIGYLNFSRAYECDSTD